MAKLLLNLRNVPDDEADEVRVLLREHLVQVYETRPSPWGISAGASGSAPMPITHAPGPCGMPTRPNAVAIARAQRQAAIAAGTAETFGALLRKRPVFVIATVLGMLIVASLVLLPFVLLRG